jgi:hypothetical protein
MRIYTEDSLEPLRARKFLAEWKADGFISQEQYEHLEQQTSSELRTTNIFLRAVLFVFTALCAVAASGLLFEVFLSRPSAGTQGIFFLLFAAGCYAGAEAAVSQYSLYRHGIEEALALCSVGFLYLGLSFIVAPDWSGSHAVYCVVTAVCSVFSLWIWHRFGLWYTFFAAMAFAACVPHYWTPSHSVQHVLIAGIYAAGLLVVGRVRARHRFDFLDGTYSVAEALLWLGIYLAINLKISALALPMYWLSPDLHAGAEFWNGFYWTTWVLTWCLPMLVLARGIGLKDRFVMGVGAVVAVLTLVSNKPYLGWERHTWDPMLLGVFLTGIALYVRRWLSQGAGGVREGFTAARLSGRDKRWLDAGSSALSFVMPQSLTPGPQPSGTDVRMGGGASGGGGTSRDF